jgi:hypothetical protein
MMLLSKKSRGQECTIRDAQVLLDGLMGLVVMFDATRSSRFASRDVSLTPEGEAQMR